MINFLAGFVCALALIFLLYQYVSYAERKKERRKEEFWQKTWGPSSRPPRVPKK